MKRLCFLAILLLIVSLISCSNNDDSVLGPASSDQISTDGNDKSVSQSPVNSAILTDGNDDGDPWEDHRPDGNGNIPVPHDTVPPDNGGDKDPVPHDPGTGD